MSASPPARPEGVELLHDGFRVKVQVSRVVGAAESWAWAALFCAVVGGGAAMVPITLDMGAGPLAVGVGTSLMVMTFMVLYFAGARAGRTVAVRGGELHIGDARLPLEQVGSRFQATSGGAVLVVASSGKSWRVFATDDLPDRDALRWLQRAFRDATPTENGGGSPEEVPEELQAMRRRNREGQVDG